MPIYEYQCKACTHKLEALQKMADAPLVDCPACAQSELQKLVSAAAFKLKGTGWYETDFKSKNQGGGEAKGDAKDSPKADAGSSANAAGTDKSADKASTAAAPAAASSPATA